MRATLLFIISAAIFLACDDDPKPPGFKDPALIEYLNAFIEQAKKHNVRLLSVDALNVVFGQVSNACGRYDPDTHEVTIVPYCWDAFPESSRESLMFHELGHALLKRDHKSDLLPNGDFASLMTPDPVTLYNEYTARKRDYYFDELFRPSTAAPDWSLPKTNAVEIFKDIIEPNTEWQFLLSGSPKHEHSISTTEFTSPTSSLAITSLNSLGEGDGETWSYWTFTFPPFDIPEGTPVEVKVKIKTSGVTGGGATVLIRGDVTADRYPVFVYGTEGNILISGTSNGFKEYSLKIPYFPSQLDVFNIYLVLKGDSQGQVYFDDVTVTKYH